MTNRVKVFIAGKSYTLQTDEEEKYVIELARKLDKLIKELMAADNSISMPDACILVAMDILDEKEKSGEHSDNLRYQIKDYIDEASRANAEVSALKKQVELLEDDKKTLQNEIQIYSLREKLGDNKKH